jgi:hypothetical protein
VVIADFGNEKFYRPRPLIFERREYLQDHFDGKINDFLHAAGFSITTDRTMHTSDMHLWVAEKTA